MFRLFCRVRVGHSDPLEAQAAQRRGVGAAAELGDDGTLDPVRRSPRVID
jgi:hypothetical protein